MKFSDLNVELNVTVNAGYNKAVLKDGEEDYENVGFKD